MILGGSAVHVEDEVIVRFDPYTLAGLEVLVFLNAASVNSACLLTIHLCSYTLCKGNGIEYL